MESERSPHYTIPERSRRTRSTDARRHRLRRLAFFSVASLWGAIAGVLGMLGLARRAVHALPVDVDSVLWLLATGVAAVVGGAVTAQAYRSVRNR